MNENLKKLNEKVDRALRRFSTQEATLAQNVREIIKNSLPILLVVDKTEDELQDFIRVAHIVYQETTVATLARVKNKKRVIK